MSTNKSKVYVYFFIILLPQLIISYPSHVKSASIEKLRSNTKGASLTSNAVNFIFSSRLYDYNADKEYQKIHIEYLGKQISKNEVVKHLLKRFLLTSVGSSKGGHFYVIKINDHIIYDSSGGKNGTIAQKFSDCLLHSTNNIFILEQIGEQKGHNGKLYYPDFSYRMAENLNMYLTFYFLELYAELTDLNRKPENFYHFNKEELGKRFDSVIDKNINKNIITEILTKFKITPTGGKNPATNEDRYTEADYIKMMKFVFSYIKDGDTSGTSFSFDVDMPQFMFLFRDVDKSILELKGDYGSGKLTDDDIKKIISDHIKRIKEKEKEETIKKLTNKDNDRTDKFYGFDEKKHKITKSTPPNIISLSYLKSLPSIYYTIFDLDRVKDIERINHNNYINNGLNISFNYTNSSSNNSLIENKYDYDKTSMNNSFKFDLILHEEFNNNPLLFDVIFNYRYIILDNTNNIAYDDKINFSYITSGINIGFKYLSSNKLNLMFLTDFSLGNIKQNNNSFIYRDINFILSNNNIINLDKNNSFKIELISSFIYTKRYLSNIKIHDRRDNYKVEDTIHNNYLLNFNLNLIKTFKINNIISNNISIGFKYLLNLIKENNDNNNTFKINNIYYKELYAIIKPTNQYKDIYSIEFNYDINISKNININFNIGKEINYKKNMFVGVGVRLNL